jgi:hypothetical protein
MIIYLFPVAVCKFCLKETRGNQELSLQPDASNHPIPKRRLLLVSSWDPKNVVQNLPVVDSAQGLLNLILDFNM